MNRKASEWARPLILRVFFSIKMTLKNRYRELSASSICFIYVSLLNFYLGLELITFLKCFSKASSYCCWLSYVNFITFKGFHFCVKIVIKFLLFINVMLNILHFEWNFIFSKRSGKFIENFSPTQFHLRRVFFLSNFLFLKM